MKFAQQNNKCVIVLSTPCRMGQKVTSNTNNRTCPCINVYICKTLTSSVNTHISHIDPSVQLSQHLSGSLHFCSGPNIYNNQKYKTIGPPGRRASQVICVIALTLVLLNLDMSCLCKQSISRSVLHCLPLSM